MAKKKITIDLLNKNRTDILTQLWYLKNLQQLPISCHKISKSTKIVAAQIARILKEFEDAGIIQKQRKGREVFIRLTTRGEKISKYLWLIIQEVENGE